MYTIKECKPIVASSGCHSKLKIVWRTFLLILAGQHMNSFSMFGEFPPHEAEEFSNYESWKYEILSFPAKCLMRVAVAFLQDYCCAVI